MCLPRQPNAAISLAGVSVIASKSPSAAAAAATVVAADTPETFITDVAPQDVILGRGAGPNEHAGNIVFRQVVADFKPSYVATVNRKAKSQIAHKVVQSIKAKRGRFLRRARGQAIKDNDDGEEVYVLAEEDVVIEKAKQALRYGKGDSGQSWPSLALSSRSSSPPMSSITASSSSFPSESTIKSFMSDRPSPKSSTTSFLTQHNNFQHNQVQHNHQQQQHQQQFSMPAMPMRRTDAAILQDALASSVREASSQQELLQILIDKAVAVRCESSSASTQLLNLVESSLMQKQEKTPVAASTNIAPAESSAPVYAPRSSFPIRGDEMASSLTLNTNTPKGASTTTTTAEEFYSSLCKLLLAQLLHFPKAA